MLGRAGSSLADLEGAVSVDAIGRAGVSGFGYLLGFSMFWAASKRAPRKHQRPRRRPSQGSERVMQGSDEAIKSLPRKCRPIRLLMNGGGERRKRELEF